MTFGATGRGNRDKIPGGGELRVETGIDGIEDFALIVVRNHYVATPISGSMRIESGSIQ
jgi:hypothetical protein